MEPVQSGWSGVQCAKSIPDFVKVYCILVFESWSFPKNTNISHPNVNKNCSHQTRHNQIISSTLLYFLVLLSVRWFVVSYRVIRRLRQNMVDRRQVGQHAGSTQGSYICSEMEQEGQLHSQCGGGQNHHHLGCAVGRV